MSATWRLAGSVLALCLSLGCANTIVGSGSDGGALPDGSPPRAPDGSAADGPGHDADGLGEAGADGSVPSGPETDGPAPAGPNDGGLDSGGGGGLDGGGGDPADSILPAGTWQLVWNDEFDGAANARPAAHWFYFMGWGSPLWRDAWYTTEDAYLDGTGNLRIRTRIDAADGNKYKTSYLQTYDWSRPTSEWTTFSPFPTKYVEARVRFDEFVAPGHWNAFWLFDPSDTYDGDPANGTEIDIMEYVLGNDPANRNWFNVANHWGTSLGQYLNAADFGVNLDDGEYHAFGLEWSASALKYYLDGILVHTITEGVSTSDGQAILLSVEIEDNAWGMGGVLSEHAADLPDYFVVDFVRVFAQQ